MSLSPLLCRSARTPMRSLERIEPSMACTSKPFSYKDMMSTNLSCDISYGSHGDRIHAMEASISGSRGFWFFVDRAWGCEDVLVSLM